MLITFSGLDGSGKSTVIGRLKSVLEAANESVVVCHMTYDVGLLAAAMAVRNRVRPGARHGRHAPPVEARHLDSWWKRLRYTVVWNKAARRFIYLVDLGIFAVFRFYVETVQGRVLIMDRYFYDTLVDVAGPRSWGWARVLSWLTPTPHVPVLLDTSPEVAFARKSEYSIDYLARRAVAYRRVFGWVPSAVVLDNVDLPHTTSELARLVTERRTPNGNSGN
jgi:hypothetical protein